MSLSSSALSGEMCLEPLANQAVARALPERIGAFVRVRHSPTAKSSNLQDQKELQSIQTI